MKADEIRQHGVSGYATAENRAIVEVLEEIAAQLAEVNERLADMANRGSE